MGRGKEGGWGGGRREEGEGRDGIYGGGWKSAGILRSSERSDIFQAEKVLQSGPTTGNSKTEIIQPDQVHYHHRYRKCKAHWEDWLFIDATDDVLFCTCIDHTQTLRK